MSSFSSVVRKPNQKIVPKSAPRRNVQKPSQKPQSTQSTPRPRSASQDVSVGELPASPTQPETQAEAGSSEQLRDISAQELISTAKAVNRASDDLSRVSTEKEASQTSLNNASGTTLVSTTPSSPVTANQNVRRSSSSDASVRGIPVLVTSNATTRRQSSTPLEAADNERNRSYSATESVGHDSEGPRKRRRVTPRAASADSSRIDTVEEAISSSIDPSVLARSATSLPPPDDELPENLLQSATASAATVSDLANSIDSGIRSLRSRSTRSEPLESLKMPSDTPISSSRTTRQTAAHDKAIADAAAEIVRQAVGTRQSTPENAEDHEIEPTETKMGDLICDTKLGKRSDRDKKIEENWAQIQARRKEQLAKARELSKTQYGRQSGKKDQGVDEDLAAVPAELPVPETIIVNGQIVVRDESRLVDFGARLQQVAIRDAETALEDAKIFKHVHQGTIGKVNGLQRAGKWDEQSTELFYKGLRMFGTDFMMIANLFPGMNRKQIKLKYVREERTNLAKIRMSLGAREQIALDEYSKMTSMEFNDPKELQLEMEADERRLREEDEKRRREEGFVHEDADTVIESQEQDTAQPDGDIGAEDGDRARTISVRPSTDRFEAEAARIVAAAVAPRKKKQKVKDTGKVKNSKRGRKSMEGVEERIGPIDEVDR